VDLLIGDSSKIRKKLGWTPEYDFASLVREMVAEDFKRESAR
jgi:GDPmannose 4,6-dehydratase